MGQDIRIWVDLKDIRKFPEKARQIDKLLQRTFDEVMEKVYNESQVLVPVKTGALKRSGKVVKRPIGASGMPESSVTYGNGSVDYAIVVHEDLQVTHADPTRAKYLEIPLVENEKLLLHLVSVRLQKLLEE